MVHLSTTKQYGSFIAGVGMKVLARYLGELSSLSVLDCLFKQGAGVGTKLKLVELPATGRHRSKKSLGFRLETNAGPRVPVQADEEILCLATRFIRGIEDVTCK